MPNTTSRDGRSNVSVQHATAHENVRHGRSQSLKLWGSRAVHENIQKQPTKPAVVLKPIFLHWTDVLEADVDRLGKAETKAQVKQILAECLRIDESDGWRKDILADMHYHNYTFCVSCKLSPIKTSCLLSLMKAVLENAVPKRLAAKEAFQHFKDLLLKHGVERPPMSVGVFVYEDIQKILEYAHNTFFRHYRLYMYTYMTHCDMAFRAEDKNAGTSIPYHSLPLPLPMAFELEAESQPEFAHLFALEREQAAAERDKPEDRATVIKRKVDEGVQQLMRRFEEKLGEQDTKFSAALLE